MNLRHTSTFLPTIFLHQNFSQPMDCCAVTVQATQEGQADDKEF